MQSTVSSVIGCELLNSRGNPTVEVKVYLDNGVMGRDSVPPGASTGVFEAYGLRDTDSPRFLRKGVSRAAEGIRRRSLLHWQEKT